MNKSIFQSFNTMTTKQLNRRIVFTFAMASVFYAGLAYCQNVSTVIDSAERIDKMSATGIMASGFILMAIANIYLIRLVFGKMNDTLKENTVALTQVADAVKRCDR